MRTSKPKSKQRIPWVAPVSALALSVPLSVGALFLDISMTGWMQLATGVVPLLVVALLPLACVTTITANPQTGLAKELRKRSRQGCWPPHQMPVLMYLTAIILFIVAVVLAPMFAPYGTTPLIIIAPLMLGLSLLTAQVASASWHLHWILKHL